MNDLISRKALLSEIHNMDMSRTDFNNIVAEILVMIRDASPIEAVPVVHCKDCKHWGTGVEGETNHVKCCEYGKYMVGENGYCCYADMRKKVDNGNFTENGKEL